MSILKSILLIIFHPIDCMEIIKRENKFNVLKLILFWGLAIVSSVIYEYTVHFPLATKSSDTINILLEAAIVIIPLFSWVLCSYAVTALMDGESTFITQLHVSCYCLVPFILFRIIATIASQFLSIEEMGLYNVIYLAGLFWCIILLLTSVKVLNDYSLSKTIGVALISLFAIVVLWAVVLLILSFTIQLLALISNLFSEIKFRLV